MNSRPAWATLNDLKIDPHSIPEVGKVVSIYVFLFLMGTELQ
jgi:hypothetical protein